METILTIETYSKVLSLFKAKNDGFRPWMEAPFTIGSKVYATDGAAMVFFDKDLAPGYSELTEVKAETITNAVPGIRNLDIVITLNDFKSALSKAPLVEGFDEKKSLTTCESCDGHGEVDFEYYHDGKTYEMEGECPVCDGIGKVMALTMVPNGTEVTDPNSKYSIKGAFFSFSQVTRIVATIELMESNQVRLIFQKSLIGNHVLQVGNVEIVQMPMHLTDVGEPGRVIPII